MNKEKNINFKINILGWLSILLGIFLILTDILVIFNRSILETLFFFIAIPSIIFGIGILFRNNLSRIILRWQYFVAFILCALYTIFLLFFLIRAPWFLFFEGGAGIKGLITLVVITPFMFWSTRLLNKEEIKEKFNKRV